ncbi:MAG: metallophosphoesterase, partial [Candidatus Micrarchaeota archaeon]
MLKFIPDRAALLAGKALVLGDLHIGLEHDLFKKGVRAGSQMGGMLASVLGMIEEYSSEVLVFLGDVKHNVPDTPLEESKDISRFFAEISSRTRVVITPGNHDGGLGRLIQNKKVEIASPGGFVFDGVSFFHGHAWPSLEAMSQNTIIMAHQHPCVEFIDKLGGRSLCKAWCMGEFSEATREKYEGLKPNAKVVITPAFNPLTSGAVLNRSPQDGLQ